MIPGGPGLSVKTLERISSQKEDFCFLVYESGDAATGAEAFKAMVARGVAILEQVSILDRNICGHSFGGLVAKEIANQIEVNNCVMVCTPIDTSCYQSAIQNYNLYASIETRYLEEVYKLKANDENLTAWLASYGRLYFSEGQIEAGRKLLCQDLANAKVFQQLSGYGASACYEITKKEAKGNVTLVIAEDDNLISSSVLKNCCVKLKINFVIISSGSHFCVYENPTEIIKVLNSCN